MRAGAVERASFIFLKLLLHSFFHLEGKFFFNIVVRGCNKVAMFGMNLLMKLFLPMKIFRPFLCVGKGSFRMVETRSGSIEIPCLEKTCPGRSLPSWT